jgi:hypothetical protein
MLTLKAKMSHGRRITGAQRAAYIGRFRADHLTVVLGPCNRSGTLASDTRILSARRPQG